MLSAQIGNPNSNKDSSGGPLLSSSRPYAINTPYRVEDKVQLFSVAQSKDSSSDGSLKINNKSAIFGRHHPLNQSLGSSSLQMLLHTNSMNTNSINRGSMGTSKVQLIDTGSLGKITTESIRLRDQQSGNSLDKATERGMGRDHLTEDNHEVHLHGHN